jgi:Flp pilus assembly pilin Flp
MVGLPPSPPQTRFSADGFWWWDGAEWRPALSQDRLWRWTGQGWVPALAARSPGSGPAVGLTIGLIAGFLGILALVGLVVIAILYTMGNQITNVFSNVVSALGSP